MIVIERIDKGDVVLFEDEEWVVYWEPSPEGQVELVENCSGRWRRNTVAFVDEVKPLRKANV